MKFFAVTPDNISLDELREKLPLLRKQPVTFLYLRAFADSNELRLAAEAAVAHGIVPVVPYRYCTSQMPRACGAHFKASEIQELVQAKPAGAQVITASAHTAVWARLALQAGSHYVYVSPIFPTLSKPGDMRELFPRKALSELIVDFGDRIILLGGLTCRRIEDLKNELPGDFSVAGITLFFGTAFAQ